MLVTALVGLPAPDVISDGLRGPSEATALSIHDNLSATGASARFADLDLAGAESGEGRPSTDLDPYRAPLDPLPPVAWSRE